MTGGSKILSGLEDALRFSQCNHVWLVEDIREGTFYRLVYLRCKECGMLKTKFEGKAANDK